MARMAEPVAESVIEVRDVSTTLGGRSIHRGLSLSVRVAR